MDEEFEIHETISKCPRTLPTYKQPMIFIIPVAIAIAAIVALTLFVAAAFRVVVSTN